MIKNRILEAGLIVIVDQQKLIPVGRLIQLCIDGHRSLGAIFYEFLLAVPDFGHQQPVDLELFALEFGDRSLAERAVDYIQFYLSYLLQALLADVVLAAWHPQCSFSASEKLKALIALFLFRSVHFQKYLLLGYSICI